MKYAFLFLPLVLACSQQPYQDAFEAFERVHGPSTERCQEQVFSAQVERVPQAKLQLACLTTVPVDGCSFGESQRVFLLNTDAGEDAFSHELLHVLLFCEFGSGDHDHLDKAFKLL